MQRPKFLKYLRCHSTLCAAAFARAEALPLIQEGLFQKQQHRLPAYLGIEQVRSEHCALPFAEAQLFRHVVGL